MVPLLQQPAPVLRDLLAHKTAQARAMHFWFPSDSGSRTEAK